MIGLLLVGGAGTQLLMPRTVVAAPAATSDKVGPQSAETPSTVLPDVLGLDEETARRVLADAAVRAEVRVDTAPAAGPAGVVVAQDPAPGMELAGAVTLTLSERVDVPEGVVGVQVQEARTLLEGLGAVVWVTRTVDLTQPEGVVLSSTPAVGEALGPVVNLTVASPGQGVSLTDLSRVDSDSCSRLSQGSVNGVAVEDSLECDVEVGDEGPAYAEWVLGRHGAVLEATAGALDSGEAGTATVRVLGDGAVLAEVPVQYGATTPLRVDVTGVLRLRVEVHATGGAPTVVLGDARVLGTQEQVTALQEVQ